MRNNGVSWQREPIMDVPQEQVLLRRIPAIFLSCEDKARARRFYSEVLGLGNPDDLENLHLVLMGRGKDHKPIAGPPALFNFYAEDIPRAYEVLKAKGVKILDEIQEYGGAFKGFHIEDTEGNCILIMNG